jgi:hypothetical protein
MGFLNTISKEAHAKVLEQIELQSFDGNEKNHLIISCTRFFVDVKLEPFEGHVLSVSLEWNSGNDKQFKNKEMDASLGQAVSCLGYDGHPGPVLLELSGLLEHVALLTSSKELEKLESFESNFEKALQEHQQLSKGWEPTRTAAGIFLRIKAAQNIRPPVPKAQLEVRLRSALTSWGRHRQLEDDEDDDGYIARQHFEQHQLNLQERQGRAHTDQLPFGLRVHFCNWNGSLAVGLFFSPPIITTRRIVAR